MKSVLITITMPLKMCLPGQFSDENLGIPNSSICKRPSLYHTDYPRRLQTASKTKGYITKYWKFCVSTVYIYLIRTVCLSFINILL
jgi:hypothetical protein